ncbi:MAG: terpene cyclase/mutase family protein [Planctomycetia bacterium]|nr:terpene cyclase/mutase family protein [Planctomycetia bacterium]
MSFSDAQSAHGHNPVSLPCHTMSETPDRPMPPEKPAWLRRPVSADAKADAVEPSREANGESKIVADATTHSPALPKKKAVKRRSQTTDYVPAPKPPFSIIRLLMSLSGWSTSGREDWTITDWLRHWWTHNRAGLLTSAGLHGLFFVLFAIWILPSKTNVKQAMIDAGWVAIESQMAQAAMASPAQISVKLNPVTIGNGPENKDFGKPDATEKAKGTPASNASGAGPVGVSPVGVGSALGGRSGGSREGIWGGLGVGTKPQTGIGGGLAWLVRQQEKGGNWKLHEGYPDPGERTIRTDTGATALALLAFLGDGHTTNAGQHAKVVSKGIAWLKANQKANGDFHDHEELGRQTAFYAHSQATIAMCEAYALTNDFSLKLPCEKAVKFLMASQHPQNGGWRYQPQNGLSMGDLSVTGWALMALHSARMAKIDVPVDNFERASLFLDSVSEQNGARFKYQPNDPFEKVSLAMTAEGLLCRQWLGWPKDHPPQKEALSYLVSDENQPSWLPGRRNVYAWYYTAQALHNLGGPQWEAWYQQVSKLILANQQLGSGEVSGSWHPNKPPGSNEEYAGKGGRLYLTTLCLLVLETPIRHAAIYEAAK